MRHRAIAAVFAALPVACGTINQGPVPTEPARSEAVEQVAVWMAGNYSSQKQAAESPADYKHVVLHMARIWPDERDGRWLYVEQAMAESADKPYRQRIYHVVAHGEGIRSMVFELPGDPLAYAGAWAQPDRFNALEPALLVPREGCSVDLKRTSPDRWTGATRPEACESTLRGAKYATSEVTLTPSELTSWDRGYDAQGKQVWGATKGPYIFIKETTR
jgi:hypothetical protein